MQLDQALISLVSIELLPIVFALPVQLGKRASGTGGNNRLESLGFACGSDGCIGMVETTGFDPANCAFEMGTAECEGFARCTIAREKLVTVLIATERTNDTFVEVVEERMNLVFGSGSSRACGSRRWSGCGCYVGIARLFDFVVFVISVVVAEGNEIIHIQEVFVIQIIFIVCGRAVLCKGTVGVDAGEGIEGFRRTKSLTTDPRVPPVVQTAEGIAEVGHGTHHDIARITDHGRCFNDAVVSGRCLSRCSVNAGSSRSIPIEDYDLSSSFLPYHESFVVADRPSVELRKLGTTSNRSALDLLFGGRRDL